MKKITITSIIIFIVLIASAQTNNDSVTIQLQQAVLQLKTEQKNQKADFLKQQSETNKIINDLRSEIANGQKTLAVLADSLGIQIVNTQTNAEQQIHSVRQTVSKNTLYWIIAALTIALLSILLFWLLRRKQLTDKADMIEQLTKTRASIMSESAKLDKELADLLEKQLSALSNTQINDNNTIPIDHTMPLKIADEITRINAYANMLDPNSQDAKALKSSIKKLFNTFKVAQYEIVDLLGQKYDDGLKVIVINAVPDKNLKEGEEIISRIIKPLVKYKGEQIQAAQVEISVGELKTN